MAGTRTTLQKKLNSFRQAEAELGQALEANLPEWVNRVELQLSQLHRAICSHPNEDLAELGAQMRFLIDRLVSQSVAGTDSADYLELCDLITSRLAGVSELPSAPLITEVGSGHLWHDDSHPLQRLSVAELVDGSSDRISIIDTSYRYLHTSSGNARFYETVPDRIVGKHLAEVIGNTRFDSRGRGHLDACFTHGTQDYNHMLEIDGQTRIMNCRMSPVHDRHHVLIGAMVTMRDMTAFHLGNA